MPLVASAPKASAAACSDEPTWWHSQSSHSLSQYACPIVPRVVQPRGEAGQTPKERVIPGVVESAYKHQRQDVGRLGKQLDLPFTTWSVTRLAGYSASTRGSRSARVGLPDPARGWDPVAARKTWKASRDPDFAATMARILAVYDRPPADRRAICVDEFVPLSLQPRPRCSP